MPRQPRKRRPKPSDRPQTEETWGVLVTQLGIWITPEDAPPSRPFLVLVLDLDHDQIPAQDMFSEIPTPDDVEAVLADAMNRPASGGGKPRRPAKVALADAALAQTLASALARVDVSWEVRPLPELENVVRLLEEHMHGPEHPGLLSVKGTTPEFVGAFFAAAADFYRAKPWVQLNNGQTFALQIPAEGGPRWIASVMGNGGMEYGLGVYKSWESFEKMFMGAADNPRELLSGHLAVLYDGPNGLPFDDFDALQHYRWEVAGADAYPMPVVVEMLENLRRPDLAELRYLEAALRAIPQLVHDHLKSDGKGDYQPFEKMLIVPTYSGPVSVLAVYPAGQLPLEKRPVHSDDWRQFADDDDGDDEGEVPLVDRRMMEGMMAQLGADLGAQDSLADPKLRQAQKLMYKAWDESNPAKRLALAHQALATSPDCVDAYVLLAEEEADSLARAAEYYRQGKEAGERALGAEYFKENVGHFWSLLETRPYMRAREGLANTLWSLKRRDEAVEHYRALLELNPGDNQGVRYMLLSLLLELDRTAEAVALLKQFDDGMAEWLYTWALVEFRKGGAGRTSERRLKAALKHNKHAPAYLTGRKRIPNPLPPYFGFGDEAEAIHYAHRYLSHWRRTPGAVEWLKSRAK